MLYQPLAVAYHQEGTTFGVGLEKQALMDTNQKLFQEKWHIQLKANHCSSSIPAGGVYRALRGPRILWLDSEVPESDRDTTPTRTLTLLRVLVDAGYDVTLQPTVAPSVGYTLEAQFYGVDVLAAWDAEAWQRTTQGKCQYDGIVISKRSTYLTVGHQVGVPLGWDLIITVTRWRDSDI